MGNIPAGQRDQRVQFERAAVVTDDHGEDVSTWAALGEPRSAKVVYGRGEERREAARQGATQTATFIVLADELTRTIVTGDRIAFSGTWDINGIAPRGRGEIEFSGVRGPSTGSG